MIPSKELRIGNWVARYSNHFRNDFIGYEKVKEITDKGLYGDLPSSYCERIKITRKILELNTELRRTLTAGVWSLMDEDLYLKEGEDSWNYMICISCNNGEFLTIKTIKYLHELQNLFFILNGKELSIKL